MICRKWRQNYCVRVCLWNVSERQRQLREIALRAHQIIWFSLVRTPCGWWAERSITCQELRVYVHIWYIYNTYMHNCESSDGFNPFDGIQSHVCFVRTLTVSLCMCMIEVRISGVSHSKHMLFGRFITSTAITIWNDVRFW